MSYFAELPPDAGPPAIYAKYPAVYGPWSEMSQVLMNGESPLSNGERELIFSFAAGASGCQFASLAHAEVAYEWGIEHGLVEQLLEDFDSAPAAPKLKALLAFVAKLAGAPTTVTRSDAEAVFAAGWDEHALHDAIAITGRAAFMHRLISGFGFAGMTREDAAARASRRVEKGYVNLFPQFRKSEE